METREEWLTEGLREIDALLAATGTAKTLTKDARPIMDASKVSLGFPRHRRTADKTCLGGELLDASMSTGNLYEVYIPPTISTGLEALECLFHQTAHLIVHMPHTWLMSDNARSVQSALPEVEAMLGAFPHAAVVLSEKKAATRLLLAQCPNLLCSAITSRGPWQFRITASRAEQGLPTCPVCGVRVWVKSISLP